MDIETIKSIPIAEYLASLGYHPSKNKGGGKLRYMAKWRGGDDPNGVSVDSERNVWYDHIAQCGGSVVDLCMTIHGYSNAEALKHLTEWLGGDAPKTPVVIPDETPSCKAVVTGVTGINNCRLLDYFKFQRCIEDKWLHRYSKQIYYTIEGKPKKYYAIGIENLSGGWSYRTASPNGKGCIGKQDISVFNFTKDHKYMVFEGFTNFLSFLTLYGEPTVNVIVLNSVSNTNKAVSYLRSKRPSALYLLLDNDNAGNIATQNFGGQFPDVTKDKRSLYAQFNDLNDYLIAKNGK